jgi:predicted Zn finger-like uncharacterized protein
MSQMSTTCPACRSHLAVSAVDLRVGQGYVRCGRCDRVFNALITLVDDLEEDEQSGLAATGTTTMPVLDDPDLDVQASGEEIPAEELAEELAQKPSPAVSSSRDDFHVDVVESQATGTFETIILEGDGYLQTEEHVDESIVNATLSELTQQIDGRATEEEAPPAEEIVLETEDEAAEEEFDADAAVGNRRRRHWVWWLVIFVLALALAAMLLHNNRQALVARPGLERPVKSFYGLFGVTVEPNWDVKAYDVRRVGGDVVADINDSFTVQASVRNLATIAQPPPVIRAELLDQFDNVVSTTDIRPSEYLLSAAPARMAPDQRFDMTLRLNDPTGKAMGFRLDACLPLANGTLVCNDP